MRGGKVKVWIIVIVGIAVALGIVWFALNPSVVEAQLKIERGEVEVLSEGAWQVAVDDMKLRVGNRVRTGEDARAQIIFFETSMMRLDEGTEVLIKSIDRAQAIVYLVQDQGRSWNKVVRKPEFGLVERFVRLAGVGGYSVETPTFTAAVRGTSFGVYVDLELVSVREGEVVAQFAGEEVIVEENHQARKEEEEIMMNWFEEDEWSEESALIEEQFEGDVKAMLKEKYAFAMNMAKIKYDLEDEEIDSWLDDYIAGELEPEEIERVEKEIEGLEEEADMPEQERSTEEEEREAGADFDEGDVERERELVKGEEHGETVILDEDQEEEERLLEDTTEPAPENEESEGVESIVG